MPRARAWWLALLLLVAGVHPAAAQVGDLFEPGVLQELRLFMNSRDLVRLRERYDENTFYPADLAWGDTRVRNVALRSRGGGSRNASKVGLLIEFDRYASGQTFAGRQSLVLDNLWQDPSMVRESVTMALFTRLGQAASMESYAVVSINGESQGVYAIVESIDAALLARTGGDPSGVVHEYHWLRPYYLEDLGDALEPYEALFEARTHRMDAPAPLYGPVRDMVRAVNGPFDDSWRPRVEEHVDLAQLVTNVAIETFVSEFDGMLGYAGMNNVYLYRPAASSRFQWLPWDRDNAFQEVDAAIFRRVDENVLVRRALTQPDLYALYLDVLEEAARVAAADGWLEGQIRTRAELIAPPAAIDTSTPYSNEQREQATADLIAFARQRPGIVLQQVQDARSAGARLP